MGYCCVAEKMVRSQTPWGNCNLQMTGPMKVTRNARSADRHRLDPAGKLLDSKAYRPDGSTRDLEETQGRVSEVRRSLSHHRHIHQIEENLE